MRVGLAAVAAVLAVGVAACGSDSPSAPTTSPKPAKSVTRTTKPRQRPARPGTPPADPSLPRDVAVPVLMYHVINAPPAGTPFPELWVPADRFAAEVRALAGAGYHGVTLSQVDAHWRRGAGLPAKPLVVSFDDGYLSQYRSAAPVLRKLRWPGVLNMEVHNLHVEGGLSPRMVRALIAAGWELGAHTINHLDLTQVDAATLAHEVSGSREALRRRFHVPVNFFCYPAGKYDDAAIAAVRAAGFRGATTVEPGLARPDERYALRRVRVNGSDTPESVRQGLAALGA
jgi:peptidoglycan/xylan/chitin deacetylase (PgdA/CDA1 family)